MPYTESRVSILKMVALNNATSAGFLSKICHQAQVKHTPDTLDIHLMPS